ncbi:MAG: hypothetical protein R3C03_02670 [Pirellulaceae bacterium]
MLKLMPPGLAPNLSKYDGSTPLIHELDLPEFAMPNLPTNDIEYRLHLPPEYDPYRKYPLLVVLPGGGDAEQTLNLWSGGYNEALKTRQGFAPRNGYITLAVDWKRKGKSSTATPFVKRWRFSNRSAMRVVDIL